jgi:ferredoxin
MQIFLSISGILIFLFFFAFFVTSLIENEKRAALISLLAGLFIPVPFLIPFFSNLVYPGWLSIALTGLIILPFLVILVPVNNVTGDSQQVPSRRFDERDTILSRRILKPGTVRFKEYYQRNPDKKESDDKFRKKPGLLKAGSKYYDPVLFAAAESLFERVEMLHPRVDGDVEKKKTKVDPVKISEKLRNMLLGWGAHSAGITELKDYHIYSFGGRGDRYGQPYQRDHKYAIALTVEMNHSMMKSAPAAPTVLESASQYLNSGTMAVQLAEFIRALGYPARAHIDANYKVICPLVARDAGLGEIGRMGLLMTPALGPRVRIAVVTTDLPVIPGKHKSDPTVSDFCRHCRKCADACPVQAIPYRYEKVIDGIKRWQINAESCYTFWCIAGTDCGNCVIACPYSHPDYWIHRLVRFGIKNSLIFRRMAIKMDDLFYGRRGDRGVQ